MKVSLPLILASLVTLAAPPAFAGEQFGNIVYLNIRDSDGLLWVGLSGNPTGRPACAVGTRYWIIPNENTETGQRLYATLLAANMAGRAITITGKNTCTRWGDGEDIDFVEVWGPAGPPPPQ